MGKVGLKRTKERLQAGTVTFKKLYKLKEDAVCIFVACHNEGLGDLVCVCVTQRAPRRSVVLVGSSSVFFSLVMISFW